MEQNNNPEHIDNTLVCSCERITGSELTECIQKHDLKDLTALQEHSGAGTGCGRCIPKVEEMLLLHSQLTTKVVVKKSLLDAPDTRLFCGCHKVSKGMIIDSIQKYDITTIADIQRHTQAGTGCGRCLKKVEEFASGYLQSLGKELTSTEPLVQEKPIITGSILEMPDETIICSCESVTKGRIIESIKQFDLTNVAGIKQACKAGTRCGGCVPMLDDLLTAHLRSQGKEVKKVICEHFGYTRQELFDLIKIGEIKTFDELLLKHGKGHGCEICKPLGASLLASAWNDVIVKQSTIQDTNDRFLANIQRGGTYSVVPRIPGGEINPVKLIAIGRIAQRYNLYTKITGGQRIDMFGARVDQLPDIWKELIDEGFESGHAYGKSLRTVKSCVGSTWCRFGLNDSVSFAIEVEERYKGLRAPHKIKGGVSGCIRECAEARGKDFGIIATEKGWNLYVCGNGGANPAHAVLLAADLDKETCLKYLDRFLIYYIKTAGPLTRTAKWLTTLDGGIGHLKQVITEDSLGLGAQFEAEMQTLIDNYKCEWKEVVKNPELSKKFKAFINSEEHDKNIEFIGIRDQKMPPAWNKD
jgi:NAD(P)H-nitrite reductase